VAKINHVHQAEHQRQPRGHDEDHHAHGERGGGAQRRIVNAAVIGIPDMRLGEKLCAFVQAAEGFDITMEEIQQLMQEQGVAVYQWPERLEVVRGWPLTALNKIDKRLLRAYSTAKLVEEGAIDAELGDDFLKKDKLSLADITSGKVNIQFTGSLS